ncbi:hypothetical protein R1sor_012582 [Riccia sorocarpa]|uniref:Uncharacterized protein n=1 Tax=Riccia sorocarpa TaxID=122646 RepID=A0ABD3I5D4_9MARC
MGQGHHRIAGDQLSDEQRRGKEQLSDEQRAVERQAAEQWSDELRSCGVNFLGVTMAHIPMTRMNRALLSELKAMCIVFIGHDIPALQEGLLDRVNEAIRRLGEFVLPLITSPSTAYHA